VEAKEYRPISLMTVGKGGKRLRVQRQQGKGGNQRAFEKLDNSGGMEVPKNDIQALLPARNVEKALVSVGKT